MNTIYSIGRRKLTLWHADGNGKRVCITTHRPLKTTTEAEWREVIIAALNENGLTRAAAFEATRQQPGAGKGK